MLTAYHPPTDPTTLKTKYGTSDNLFICSIICIQCSMSLFHHSAIAFPHPHTVATDGSIQLVFIGLSAIIFVFISNRLKSTLMMMGNGASRHRIKGKCRTGENYSNSIVVFCVIPFVWPIL